jgi:Raf kinase inhibitor-like YbhB/YbcL family protein
VTPRARGRRRLGAGATVGGVSRPRTAVLVTGLVLAGLLGGCGFVNAGKEDDDASAIEAPATLAVTSPAFDEGAAIPRDFSCKGANTSPPLAWSGVPAGARSLALVVDDQDAPNGTYTHWVVYNIDPAQSAVAAGEVPEGAEQADNSGGQLGYAGPCPPSGTHHYRFTVYVLRSPLTVPAGGEPGRVLVAIRGKTTARGTLTGTFAAD